MIRILLNGADGRMGSRIDALCADQSRGIAVVARRARPGEPAPEVPFDAIIDFSSDAGLREAVSIAVTRRVPLLSGTTGLTPQSTADLQAASRLVAVLHASNTSLGVAVARRLVRDTAMLLRMASGDEFAFELTETHHVHKRDAPSGTALALADAIDRGFEASGAARRVDRSRITSIRHGEVVGDHAVHARGPGEVLGITHHAESRDLFALGAIRLVRWLASQPAGLHTVDGWLDGVVHSTPQAPRPVPTP